MTKNLALLIVASLISAHLPAQTRIISLSPHTTELVYDAGLGDQLVAVSAYSDYPPAAQKIEQVSDYKGINIERILMLKPSLVVAWKGGNPEKSLKKLESLGIKVFYSSPKSFDDIADNIEKLGRFAPDSSIARNNAQNLRNKIRAIEQKYQNQSKISYFYQIGRTTMMSHNDESWPAPIFKLCGGKNIFADSLARYPKVNLEQILKAQPEAIFGSNKENPYVDWKKWKTIIPAVQTKAVFSVKGNGLSRPTSRAVEALDQVCQYLDQVRAIKHVRNQE